MIEALVGPIITLCIAALCAWDLIRGFRSGKIEIMQPAITFSGRRLDQPIRFWTIAAALAVFLIGSLYATVAQIAAGL